MKVPHTFALYGLLFSAADAAFNLYQSDSDLPDGVNATSTCGIALNATIACDSSLGAASGGAQLEATTLNTLCVSSCYSSLKAYRASIASSCDSSAVIQGTDATFPITYMVDNLIYTYNSTCLKDASTGTWCAQVFNGSWPGTTTDQGIETLNTSILCSSCNIQSLIQSEQSVFDYDPDFVSTTWPTIQSKCGITTTITAPGQAYLNITTPDPGTLTCQSGKNYTVKSGDNCQTIASSQNVGTNDLIAINSIMPGCTSIWVGQVLCLPPACQTYVVQSGDTCDSIVSANAADMTYAQLLSWNPTIDPWCSNLIAGINICIRTPGGPFTPNAASASAIPTGTLITTATPAPTGTAPGAPTNCGRWYIVQPGETCNTVILSQGVTMADFLAANPQINANCTNLWAATAYCVYQVVKGPTPTTYVPVPTTIANGTTTNCYQYYTAVSGDTCASISYTQVTNVTDFMRWNTGLNSQCTNLAAGSAYCIWGDPAGYTATTTTGTPIPTATMAPTTAAATDACTWTWCNDSITGDIPLPTETSTATITASATTTASTNTTASATITASTTTTSSASPTATGVARPTNAAPNSTTSCTKWYTVVSGDYCYLICQNEGCTVANLETWNPDLGSNCVAQLGVAYCVAA